MGSSKSPAPQFAPGQEEAFRRAIGLVGQATGDPRRFQPGFGMDLSVAPDISELAARSAVMRTYGGQGFRDIQEGIGDLAMTGGFEDSTDVLRAIKEREFDVGSARIKEQLGSQAGTMFTQALPYELGRFRADLGERLAREAVGLREAALNRRLQASALFPQVAGAAAEQLRGAGANIRGIREANLQRRYQDILLRRFQLPFQGAGTLTGAAGAPQYYQPTYGPGPAAGALSGALSGAGLAGTLMSAGAINSWNPWGWAMLGGGALLGAMS